MNSTEWRAVRDGAADTVDQYRAISDEILAQIANHIRKGEILQAKELTLELANRTGIFVLLIDSAAQADARAKRLDSTLN